MQCDSMNGVMCALAGVPSHVLGFASGSICVFLARVKAFRKVPLDIHHIPDPGRFATAGTDSSTLELVRPKGG